MDLIARLTATVTDLMAANARVLVGIDGPDAAGKTTIADRLAEELTDAGVQPVRASVDDFHNPREVRTAQGALSPEGCYRDSFNYPALRDGLLLPFANGARKVVSQCFDYRLGVAAVTTGRVPERALLILDGVYLLRPALRDLWTLAVYLHVTPDVALERAKIRDRDLFGSIEEVERRYRQRYLPAQDLYRMEADPERLAHVVIDNTDLAESLVLRWQVPPRH